MNLSRPAFLRSFLAAALLLPATCVRAADAPRQDHSSAVAHLGDPNPAVRAEAIRKLEDAGKDAESLLKGAAESDNPEVAASARRLLHRLSGQNEQVPKIESPTLNGYRLANEGLRRRIILEQVSRPGIATLARLWGIERDAELRALIFQRLLNAPSVAASAFLADGNATAAELVLDLALTNHSEEAVAPYTILCRAQGALHDAILHWSVRARQDPGDLWPQRVLASLYRAAGDAGAAQEAARKSQNEQVLEETLLATGDFTGLAATLRARSVPLTQVRDLTLLLACDDLSGDAVAFEDDLKRTIAAINSPQDAIPVSNVLLMCGRPDEATRLLIDQHDWSAAFEIMAARGKFDEAFALEKQHDAESGDFALLLRIAAARLLDRLGERKSAQDLLARVGEENKIAGSGQVSLELGMARREVGQEEAAWDDFADAITRINGEFALALPISRIFDSPDQEIDFFGLWRLLQQTNPVGSDRRNLQIMRSVHDRTMPVDQVRDLARWNGHGPPNAPVRGQLVWESARRMADSGQMAQARALLESEAHRFETPDLLLRVGDLAADRGEWDAAAQWYGVSWETDRLQPLPLYLRAIALAKGQDRAHSAEASKLAGLVSMANDRTRYEAMRELEQRGLRDALAMETKTVLATGQPLGLGFDNASRIGAQAAAARGDSATALALLKLRMSSLGAGRFWFRDRVGFLAMALHRHRAAAGVALAAGDSAGFQHEVQACETLDPVEIEFSIELVHELEKWGHPAEAEALFGRSWDIQQKLGQRCPNSAYQHNQSAWLAAECNRELDVALQHATRAVALDPKKSAYLDTLAEVHFRRGQIDQAIAEMKQCLQMQPRNRQHLEHLAKFEAAKH